MEQVLLGNYTKKVTLGDNTGHKGGVWKEVDRNGVRIRKLDANLNPIGE